MIEDSISLLRSCSFVLLSSIAALGSACAEDEENCGGGDLAAALAAARPGDTVSVGACEVVGPLRVPAGVTLRGAGRSRTVLRGEAGTRAAVTLESRVGIAGTSLADLTIESASCAGLVAHGGGEIIVRDVSVAAWRGMAFGAEQLDRLRATDVTLVGPVAPGEPVTSPPLPPYQCNDLATHGLVLVDVRAAELVRLTSSDFAAFGVLTVASGVTWQTGRASDNVGVGLETFDGTVNLQDVELCRSRQEGLVPAFGGVFSGDATVSTVGLSVCDSQGYGIVHDGGVGEHAALSVTENRFTGVWIRSSADFRIGDSESELLNNGFAAIVAMDSPGVTVSDARIDGTQLKVDVVGESAGSVSCGDGVQLVRSSSAAFTNVSLSGNERTGILIDSDSGSLDGLSFTSVTVDGTGAQLGVVAQGLTGPLPSGWDSGVTRRGATAINDTVFSGRLERVGAVVPNYIPVPPELETSGLDLLIGP